MSQARNYRVGIEIITKYATASAGLKKLSRELRDLDKQAAALSKRMSHLGTGGTNPSANSAAAKAAAARKQALADAKAEGKLAEARAKAEARIAQIRSKEAAAAEVERQREQRANLDTMRVRDRNRNAQRTADQQHLDSLARAAERQRAADQRHQDMVSRGMDRQRSADTAHETALKRQLGLQQQLDRAAARGATQQAIAQERLNQQRMRTVLLQQRYNRATAPKLTADQQYVQGHLDRFSAATDAGNRISTYGQIARAGLSPALAIAHLGHDEAIHHNMKEQAGLEQMNLGANDLKRAMEGAERVRRMVPGLGATGGLDVVKDLINVTGHVSEATDPRLMKRFAQFSVGNSVAYGLSQLQSYNAIKAAELMMPNKAGMSDHERIDGVLSKLELVNKVMAGTGGRVGPNEILNFVKMSQSARMGLNEQGFLKLVPIMQEMGGARTGTAVMSVLQNLANGRATTASIKNLDDLGLINHRATVLDAKSGKMVNRQMIEEDKNGRIKRVLPGAIVDDIQLRTDPVGWFEKHIIPFTKGGNGRKPMSNAEVDRLVNSIMGNRLAAGMGMTFVSQIERIKKDLHLIEGARGIEATDAAQRTSYMRQERNVDAAFDTAKVALWKTAAPTVTKGLEMLTTALEGLNSVVADHPVATKITVASVALGGLGTTVTAGGLAARTAAVAFKKLIAAETTVGATAAGSAATGLGVFLGQLAILGGVAAGVGYSLGRLAAGIELMVGAWNKEKRDRERVNYLQNQNAIRFGGAKPFPARVGAADLDPLAAPRGPKGGGRGAAMLPLFDAGLTPQLTMGNSAASGMVAAAAAPTAPTLAAPRLEGAGTPIQLHLNVADVGPMDPKKARRVSKAGSRMIEDSLFDALTTGNAPATSVPTIVH